jgi:hypothetical protein
MYQTFRSAHGDDLAVGRATGIRRPDTLPNVRLNSLARTFGGVNKHPNAPEQPLDAAISCVARLPARPKNGW